MPRKRDLISLNPRDIDPAMPGTNCALPRDNNISARPINSGANNKRAFTSPTDNLPRRRSRIDPSQMMPSTLRAVIPSPAIIVRKGMNNIVATANAATEAMTKRGFMDCSSAIAHQRLPCCSRPAAMLRRAPQHSASQARLTMKAMLAPALDQCENLFDPARHCPI